MWVSKEISGVAASSAHYGCNRNLQFSQPNQPQHKFCAVLKCQKSALRHFCVTPVTPYIIMVMGRWLGLHPMCVWMEKRNGSHSLWSGHTQLTATLCMGKNCSHSTQRHELPLMWWCQILLSFTCSCYSIVRASENSDTTISLIRSLFWMMELIFVVLKKEVRAFKRS